MVKLSTSAVTLEHVRGLLDRGEPEKAFEALKGNTAPSPDVSNARAVCLMRLGRPDSAVAIYQDLLLKGGVAVDPKAPVVHVVNFATALVLAGNTAAALRALDALGRTDHPSAARLRAAIGRWRSSLGIFRRFLLAAYGAVPEKPVVLDFPPGEA